MTQLLIALMGCSGVALMVVAIILKLWRRWNSNASDSVSTPVNTERARVATNDYRIIGQLLTANERAFYDALRQALPSGTTVMVQVALNRVVEVRKPLRGRAWRDPRWNRIAQKSLDFVIIRLIDTRPMVVIELDDATHERPERRRRDELLDAVLASAGIPIIHQPVASMYDIGGLRMRLIGYMER